MTGTNKAKLLSSTNPQIPKGDGNEPVQAYIAAMPDWKSDIGRRIDTLVEQVFPSVRKAVKWNTPLYGKEDGWFLAMYCYKKYVQITFMQGTSLTPMPPVTSKVEDIRYLNIHEDDQLDEAQLTDWIRQASKLPGKKL
ncbi:DUF1801 domain-containing protein [Thalassospira xiamenensis]|uniref:DUF1801 domain-containing protein n=1 Tax=Thalassospira xiamenensis TaxID=220697 RepID=UPI000DEDA849|nr:DUF1801 domain-containing protein [Thalassospira xiamenensis]RCK38058.1 histidine kinase [Thalassospira xiamenensis]